MRIGSLMGSMAAMAMAMSFGQYLGSPFEQNRRATAMRAAVSKPRNKFGSHRGNAKRARRAWANKCEAVRQLAECNSIIERSGMSFEQVKGRFGCLATR